MTKADLQKICGYEHGRQKEMVRAEYMEYLGAQMFRLTGLPDQQLARHVIDEACAHLSDVLPTCNLSVLVFHHLRKEIICKRIAGENDICKNQFLRQISEVKAWSEKDTLRLDIAMLLMPPKVRTYFLLRYYYFHEDIQEKALYERIIQTLLCGKGIAKFRSVYFQVPKEKVFHNQYADYLSHLPPDSISQTLYDTGTFVNGASDVPTLLAIAERQYRILAFSVPIGILIAVALLVAVFCLL